MKGKIPLKLFYFSLYGALLYILHSIGWIYFAMACSKFLNESVWKENIEKLNVEKQRKLLGWQLQAREPIYKFSDMKKGDHLVQKKSIFGKVLYYHHFLCIGKDEEGWPRIIHYHNTAREFAKRFFPTCLHHSGLTAGQTAIVQELTLPHEDLIASESKLQAKGAEVERVVWPDELKRYTVEEVREIITETN